MLTVNELFLVFSFVIFYIEFKFLHEVCILNSKRNKDRNLYQSLVRKNILQCLYCTVLFYASPTLWCSFSHHPISLYYLRMQGYFSNTKGRIQKYVQLIISSRTEVFLKIYLESIIIATKSSLWFAR